MSKSYDDHVSNLAHVPLCVVNVHSPADASVRTEFVLVNTNFCDAVLVNLIL